ncbi:MAG: T9SS type A sorting domain-containing protein [Bacteroidales bacterium]|jgi:YVTN family beta-propeller protein
MKKILLITLLAIIGFTANAQTAYITNRGSNSVSVINVVTNTVTATIPVPVGADPWGVSVSPDGNKVYVITNSDSTVRVINTATNTVTAYIPVGENPVGIAVSPDGNWVYVTNGSYSMGNTVNVINSIADTVSATITVGTQPYGVAVSPNGSWVYVTNDSSYTVSIINTATKSVSATITGFSAPVGISVSPDGSKIYVANNLSNTVSVIDSATNTVSATIAVGLGPTGVSVSPDGSKVYVTNWEANTVSVINSTTNTVSATIAVGSCPDGVSVSPDGSKVYVANVCSATVSVINTATNTVSATILVGDYPYAFGNFISNHPTVSISALANPICAGASTTLIAKGATSYSWSDGLGTSDTVVVSPTTATTYTVTGTTTGGTGTASITINVNPSPTPTITGPTEICSDMYATLDAGTGYSTYLWSTGASTETIMVNTAGTYTVTVTNASGCSGTASANLIVHPNPVVSVTASANLICEGASTTLTATASGVITYSWNNGLGSSNPVTAMPTANTTYIVTATTIYGCTGSASIAINVVLPVGTYICMVTTDSSSYYNYNVVYWDKTPYNNVDSFIVFRKDAVSSNYLRIGAVSANALSEFTDTAFSTGGPNGGSPRYSSWQYKLAIRDTCGNFGDESPYHQSMFVQQGGSNFSWNAYTVEAGQTNPVTGYSFLRDDNNTGDWHVLINTTGLSATDPNYSSYPNGNWRIDALGFDCVPTMKLTGTESFIKSHSNTIKPVPMSIKQLALSDEQITVYPNPATNNITIENTSFTKGQTISVYDIQGQLLLQQPMLQVKTNINIAAFAKGIYFIKVENEKNIAVRKIVKE